MEGADFKLRLPSPQAFEAKIRELGMGTLMYKVDLSRAYRQLRSDPFDWAFLGISWQQENFIDVAIPFGLRHGASACQRTTMAVAEIAQGKFGAIIYPYIDDSAAGAPPALGQSHYEKLLLLMEELGLQAALAKCQAPDTTLSWIGCHFDSISMIMRIDKDKLAEAIRWCDEYLNAQTVTYKYMQRFLGKLFYAIRYAEPAKRFTMRLLDLLKAAHTGHQITIPHEARLDVLWQRAFIPLYNGENIMKPSVAERCCFVDACLSSAGGYSRQHGFYKFVFPHHMQEL